MGAVGADTSGPEQRANRAAALIVLVAGAAASVTLMMIAASHLGSSLSLILLFTVWVLWPYLLLLVLHARSRRWSQQARRSLSRLMVMLALASVASYAYAVLLQAKERPTPVFVVVPPVSVLLLGAVSALGRTLARGRSRAHHAGHW